MVGLDGLEPSTSRLSGVRSNHLSYKPFFFTQLVLVPTIFLPVWVPALPGGGDDGNRTHDPLLAGQVLSQLSYTPVFLRFLCFPFRDVGPYLSFRHVSVQVLSARHSLTSVFGMGTGGPCALTGPTIECFLFSCPCRPLKIEQQAFRTVFRSLYYTTFSIERR